VKAKVAWSALAGPKIGARSWTGIAGRKRKRRIGDNPSLVSSSGRRNLQEYPIPRPSPIALKERHRINQHSDSAQTCDDLGENPFAIGVFALLIGAVEIDTIEARNGDGEGELKESQDKADECTGDAAG